MPALPESLDPDRLLGREFPPDVTIDEVRSVVLSRFADELGGRVRVGRFLRVRYLDERGAEHPDDLTLGDARELARVGRFIVTIDDEGDGGVRVRLPELIS